MKNAILPDLRMNRSLHHRSQPSLGRANGEPVEESLQTNSRHSIGPPNLLHFLIGLQKIERQECGLRLRVAFGHNPSDSARKIFRKRVVLRRLHGQRRPRRTERRPHSLRLHTFFLECRANRFH
jgi:hypothetical protein